MARASFVGAGSNEALGAWRSTDGRRPHAADSIVAIRSATQEPTPNREVMDSYWSPTTASAHDTQRPPHARRLRWRRRISSRSKLSKALVVPVCRPPGQLWQLTLHTNRVTSSIEGHVVSSVEECDSASF